MDVEGENDYLETKKDIYGIYEELLIVELRAKYDVKPKKSHVR